MTIHEIRTDLAPEEILDRAHRYFMHTGSSYAAFPHQRGNGWLRLHLDVGEVVVAAIPQDGGTLVRGSSSRGAHLLTRFLRTLAPPQRAKREINRRGQRETYMAATVEFDPTVAEETLAA